MTVRVVVADDEPLGRAAVRELLARAPDFELVGECGNGTEALAVIRATQADAAFLDIRMPGIDGLEVARQLGEHGPRVVFVTAFDQHALAAFDRFAVDYLVKPLDPERFARTLDRLRQRGRPTATLTPADLERLAAVLSPRTSAPRRITLQAGGRTVFLHGDELVWAESSGNYVDLHTTSGVQQVRATMAELEQEFRGHDVLRIHRAFLVGVAHVRELRASDSGGGGGRLLLSDGTQLPVGRTYRQAVAAHLTP